MSGSGALKGFAPIWFGVHGLITAIRWNACLRGACPCRCARMHADAVQGRAQEAQKAPPPSRTAARGSRRPGGRSSVVDRRITRQELKEALATRTDAIMAVMLLLTYVQFQVRAAAAPGSSFAANCSRRSVSSCPACLASKPFKSLVQESEKAGRHSALYLKVT